MLLSCIRFTPRLNRDKCFETSSKVGDDPIVPVPSDSQVEKEESSAETARKCLLRKQRTISCERKHGWRTLVSICLPCCPPSHLTLLMPRDSYYATCQMSVYNFCRCRSACFQLTLNASLRSAIE